MKLPFKEAIPIYIYSEKLCTTKTTKPFYLGVSLNI